MQALGRIGIFLEVAKRQSFSAAAKAMGITGPAASKQVMALEEELGVKLLHRTTRLVTLTDEGATYYERARLAIDELREAATQLQDMKSVPKGSLRINLPLTFGQTHLLPVLSSFAQQYPLLALDITLDDRRVDVVADGYDLVVRIGVLEDSTLISCHLGECPIELVASPSYIEAAGGPSSPADLKRHRMIAYSYQGQRGEWRYKDAFGKIGSVKIDGVLRSNSAEMMLQAALDGVGIAILPMFVVVKHLQSGELVRVLPECETYPRRTIAALMPPSRYRSHKVKQLVDWLSKACSTIPLTAEYMGLGKK